MLHLRNETRRKFEMVEKGEDESGRDLLVPWVLSNSGQHNEAPDESNVFQRCEFIMSSILTGTMLMFQQTTTSLNRANWSYSSKKLLLKCQILTLKKKYQAGKRAIGMVYGNV